MWTPSIQNCDNYMDERTGKYEYRAIRYRRAIQAMYATGLASDMTIFDIGAGMTEFDYCLRTEFDWRGRYIPIDGGIDGTDIEQWEPKRNAHWFVALELLEHLHNPWECVNRWKSHAGQGIVISTPNPRTTDVIGMDPTHVTEISATELRHNGFYTTEETFYGGIWSKGEPDSLFGIWRK